MLYLLVDARTGAIASMHLEPIYVTPASRCANIAVMDFDTT
jgi:hypothetical protein